LVKAKKKRNGQGEPEDAQFGNQQSSWSAVETNEGPRQTTVPRRGQATAGETQSRAPRLQVQAKTEETKATNEEIDVFVSIRGSGTCSPRCRYEINGVSAYNGTRDHVSAILSDASTRHLSNV